MQKRTDHEVERDRASRKKLKEKRRAAGLCVLCGEKPERFKFYCTKCLRDRSEESRRYHKKHSERIAKRSKKRYDHNVEYGLCADCGHELVRDMEPGVRCVNCTEVNEMCRLLSGG